MAFLKVSSGALCLRVLCGLSFLLFQVGLEIALDCSTVDNFTTGAFQRDDRGLLVGLR